MTELLHAYDSDGNIVKTQERESLLDEIRNHSFMNGDVDLAVPGILLLLINKCGELYIVKRANKSENPNMYDKTVGGHIIAGESHEMTLIRECMEEIGINMIVANNALFEKTIEETDLKENAVATLVDAQPWRKMLIQTNEGKTWVKRLNSYIYAGIYNGDLKLNDGEATSYLILKPEDLKSRINEAPSEFTNDLNNIINMDYIKKLIQNYSLLCY